MDNTSGIIILLLGQTGAGKSTFVNTVLGDHADKAPVGHGLQSCTNEIGRYDVIHPITKTKFTFIDTPGFNDSWDHDIKRLKKIIEWLQRYEPGAPLGGIIYLHDIKITTSTTKVQLSPNDLCHPQLASHIALVTTMWDSLFSQDLKSKAYHHQELLKTKRWREMLDRGSLIKQFDHTQETAWTIINELANQESITLGDLLAELKKVLDNLGGRSYSPRGKGGFFSYLFGHHK